MALLTTRLAALNHPAASTFSPSEASTTALAAWLEDRFIRQLPMDARTELRAGEPEALQFYLAEMDAPEWVLSGSPSTMCSWLINIALQYEYGDNQQKYEALATVATAQQPIAPDNPDLLRLCAALRVTPASDAAATLQAVVKAARQRPRPPPMAAPAPKRATSALTADRAPVPVSEFIPEFTAEAFPLGFEGSGRPAGDDVARVMRMLHVQELRRLQDSVNATIVSLQEFTANPKTDARLGRVGR